MLIGALGLVVVCAGSSCRREFRSFRPHAPDAEAVRLTPLTDYRIGGDAGRRSAPEPSDEVPNGYEDNAYAVSEGKRLFQSFNCSGCHAHGGGGGMGVPLSDEKWIYGSRPEQVFSTIVAGRPNGMPSFGGEIPAYQVWQLAAYVRSLSGQLRGDVASGRADHMQAEKPESSRDKEKPVNRAAAKSTEVPP